MKFNKDLKYSKLENEIENFKDLTYLEKSFFQIMHSTTNTGGCLLISGDPGIGKTAIIRNMAKVLGYQYIDIRLSQKDESEVGLYPKVDREDDLDFVKEIPPYWAIKSNRKPTIIAFEEINRARREIQNAALQILMEREIGHDFKFNNNVYFIATSNMDDSHTEDFSTAMRGRLIHHEFEFDYDYWVDNYARENVNQVLLEWTKVNQHLLIEGPSDNEDTKIVSYLSPRSISGFSKSLDYAIESPVDIKNIISYTEQNGRKFIGDKVYDLLEFLRKWTFIKVEDILNDFDSYSADVLNMNREHVLYIIDGFKSFILDNNDNGLLKFEDKHKNIIKFLSIKENEDYDIIDQDIIVGFMNFIFEHSNFKHLFDDEKLEHIRILKLYKSSFLIELDIIQRSKISQIT